jgi:dipeptide/tripeptide permease
MSTTWNAFFIIALIPVFSEFIYPQIERRFGRFRLLDRMLVGMVFAALAFVACAILQTMIDANPDALIYDGKAKTWVCDPDNYQKCVSGLWQIIP